LVKNELDAVQAGPLISNCFPINFKVIFQFVTSNPLDMQKTQTLLKSTIIDKLPSAPDTLVEKSTTNFSKNNNDLLSTLPSVPIEPLSIPYTTTNYSDYMNTPYNSSENLSVVRTNSYETMQSVLPSVPNQYTSNSSIVQPVQFNTDNNHSNTTQRFTSNALYSSGYIYTSNNNNNNLYTTTSVQHDNLRFNGTDNNLNYSNTNINNLAYTTPANDISLNLNYVTPYTPPPTQSTNPILNNVSNTSYIPPPFTHNNSANQIYPVDNRFPSVPYSAPTQNINSFNSYYY